MLESFTATRMMQRHCFSSQEALNNFLEQAFFYDRFFHGKNHGVSLVLGSASEHGAFDLGCAGREN